MSDEELFKAIKEYEEKNNLKEVREVNKILRKIRDICRAHNTCVDCPFKSKTFDNTCLLRQDYPLFWEL